MTNFDFLKVTSTRKLAKWLVVHGFVPDSVLPPDTCIIRHGCEFDGYRKQVERLLVKQTMILLEAEHINTWKRFFGGAKNNK